MKLVTARLVAILLLVIPGILACIGFLKMKNAVYNYFVSFGYDDIQPNFEWLPFLLGLLMFAIGVGFIGGWTFFRDRKRNYVASRFRPKRPKPPKPTA
ncbi:DUF2627 domain-containing protein [Paenibacillus algorifonticola]|uniref:DUF2627 domain-containing protein n=1 Tax=Paenibacillus algorifonticola TaxID=684063 RepID=UPI003D2BBE30